MIEIKRNWNSRVYDLGGDKRALEVRNGLHDIEPDGSFVPIDTSVNAEDKWEFTHSVQRARVKIRFGDSSANTKKHLFGIEDKEGNWVNIKLDRVGYSLDEIVNGKPTFPHAGEKVTAECIPTYKGVKANYILQDDTAPNELIFTIKNNPEIVPEQSENSIIFKKDDEIIFILPPSFAIDANDDIGNVTMELIEVGGLDGIKLTTDLTWLSTASYPVTIDPSVTIIDAVAGGVVDDNFMQTTVPNNNYGGHASLILRNSTYIVTPIIKTDLTAYSSIKVTSAKFSIKAQFAGYDLDTKWSEVLRDWNEGTSSGAAQADEVTWNSAKHGSVSWTTAGCLSDGNDRNGTPDGTQTITLSDGEVMDFTLTNALVQQWVDTPSSNNGIIIQENALVESYAVTFYSSQTGTEGNRPFFYMEYTDVIDNVSGFMTMGIG